MNSRLRFPGRFLALMGAVAIAAPLLVSPELGAAEWRPAAGPLMTRWARDVSPDRPLPEYPRPQLQRNDWLNLNGLWSYAITPKDAARPGSWDGEILVPFAVESALSGVMKEVGPDRRLWYQRTFTVPQGWEGKRVRLNFGAVDWLSTVWVNGTRVGEHQGGYDAFTFDITEALRAEGEQEIVVSVWDPSDAGYQPRGKQVRNPGGIWYTPTTGIWQTVWLEPVAASFIESLEIVPNVDASSVSVKVNARANRAVNIGVSVPGAPFASERKFQPEGGVLGGDFNIVIRDVRLWSPDSPFLYDLRVALAEEDGQGRWKVVDQVSSYFGMRKIALAKDEKGVNRLFLNNQPLFQFGPLDQGFWPDGLYTAPTDEALRYDIEMTRKFGFNMARKHVKVEPDRWYYWCDKLGLLVWQDMPSGDKYIGNRDPDITRTPESGENFERELQRLVRGFFNHPSIVMWVPYNEGWGQWDTARIVDLIRKWDSTRLVDNTSGWSDRGVGDVMDIHSYPGPDAPRLEENRAGVLGEFGGLGLPVKGHTWQDERNWGYRSYQNAEDLTDAYLALIRKLHPLTGDRGLAAAVYTQTTDVEVEVNGLMTYDRALVKMDLERIAAANKSVYTPPAAREARAGRFIPPATPLVACDPYFSIWSQADELTGDDTVHWTGRPHRLTGMVRVDGKAYRWMGASPSRVPALRQTGIEVLPTRTVYTFEDAGVALTVTFMTPALPEDIDVLSRPVTYVTCEVRATDGATHNVELYLDASGELTVNTPNQEVVWGPGAQSVGGLTCLKMGSSRQAVLGRSGDDLRIDWGYLYVAAPDAQVASSGYAERFDLQSNFIERGRVDGLTTPSLPAPADRIAAGLVMALRGVGAAPTSRWMLLAYDDLYSIQYLKKNLRPYWRRNGWEAEDLLAESGRTYPLLKLRCEAFDSELMADLVAAGGMNYAKLAALAYRQCLAAGKFVADDHGQPLQFCKENHSNGCIGTSDVFYPMAPQFLLFGPTLAKSFLVPFMNYAASDRWKFPFAPHDLGTYPHANGQRYGGGERSEENQMPVEESGNLLLLMGAIAQMEGHAGFASLYWPQLQQWAEYLKAKGFDPENQLCTDDFAGHLAHNVNLSAKAICGLGAYAKLCDLRGDPGQAAEYRQVAQEFAARWIEQADDGDHYRLAFDKPGTWSQKYNLVWDRILGLNLFPDEVRQKEMDHYRRVQNRYGLPLDNRETYTKLDWVLWTATLTQDRGDFDALVQPVLTFLSETPDRSPMTDWYQTKTARKVGFTARPVVGGVFLQMLYDHGLWQKYARRDQTRASRWAPLPKPPKVTSVVPSARDAATRWRYTTRRPGGRWFAVDFDDSGWDEGAAGFGTRSTPGAEIGTIWNTPSIWIRRAFDLPVGAQPESLQLFIHHDEDAQVYLNGQSVTELNGYSTDYETVPLPPSALKSLKPGRNVLAIRCRQTGGGQYIDAGLVTVEAAE